MSKVYKVLTRSLLNQNTLCYLIMYAIFNVDVFMWKKMDSSFILKQKIH